MLISQLKNRNFEEEMFFSTSRGSGPGGQNVNKVNTQVELRFNITNSIKLSPEERNTLMLKLSTRITKEGDLVLVSNETRSQRRNKELVIQRFYLLLSGGLTLPKRRIKTKPSRASKEKWLHFKNRRAEIKRNRKSPGNNDL